DAGMRVEPHIVRGWWKDTGRLEDMLEANRLILDNLIERVDGELVDSQVDGHELVTSALAGPHHIVAKHPARAAEEQPHRIEMSELSPTMKR
ncbi:MAG: glucose-phosphate thymidylyltransferase, partial [Solirubrobacteraceae bacterium]|nr:glucose-phosphate thymidylyltransferase [Solirubrobacteraceae bacterium]